MMRNVTKGLRRAAAGLLSVLMLLTQAVLPVAALAQEASSLPVLNLSYTMGEEPRSVSVQAAMYGISPYTGRCCRRRCSIRRSW